jgi:hypothetical protein
MASKKKPRSIQERQHPLTEHGELFATDGRKLEDVEFVGARTPDADPEKRPRKRAKRPFLRRR